MKDVTLDMTKDMAPQLTLTVGLGGVRPWLIRAWVGTRLIRLAGRIMNTRTEIDLGLKD